MRDAENPPLAIRDTWSATQSVLHSAISKTTTHSRRYVTPVVHCHSQFLLVQASLCNTLVPSKRESTQRFQTQANRSRAVWPCCDDTSSDDDEHNTDNPLLLLFADADIAPALLAGLSDVDVLYIALGCRFALDIFTVAQQYRPLPDLEPLPHDAELGTLPLSYGATPSLLRP